MTQRRTALSRCAACLLSGMLVFACGDEAGSYLPARAGLIWEYDLTLRSMDGHRHLKQVYYAQEARQEDEGLHIIRQDLGGRYHHYRDSSAGIDELIAGGVRRLIARPFQVGTAWRGTTRTRLLEKTGPPQETLFRIVQALPMHYRIAATDVVIEVPAGVYRHCLLVEGKGARHVNVGNYIGETDIHVETRDWYAPGVGLVRSERRESTSSPALDRGELVQVLERFRD